MDVEEATVNLVSHFSFVEGGLTKISMRSSRIGGTNTFCY
jgi:hypothetical protein